MIYRSRCGKIPLSVTQAAAMHDTEQSAVKGKGWGREGRRVDMARRRGWVRECRPQILMTPHAELFPPQKKKRNVGELNSGT